MVADFSVIAGFAVEEYALFWPSFAADLFAADLFAADLFAAELFVADLFVTDLSAAGSSDAVDLGVGFLMVFREARPERLDRAIDEPVVRDSRFFSARFFSARFFSARFFSARFFSAFSPLLTRDTH